MCNRRSGSGLAFKWLCKRLTASAHFYQTPRLAICVKYESYVKGCGFSCFQFTPQRRIMAERILLFIRDVIQRLVRTHYLISAVLIYIFSTQIRISKVLNSASQSATEILTACDWRCKHWHACTIFILHLMRAEWDYQPRVLVGFSRRTANEV